MLDPQRMASIDVCAVDGLGPETHAAGVHAIDDDALRVGGPERAAKARGRTLRVEAADAVEALAHRREAQREQFVEVGFGDGREAERRRHGATV